MAGLYSFPVSEWTYWIIPVIFILQTKCMNNCCLWFNITLTKTLKWKDQLWFASHKPKHHLFDSSKKTPKEAKTFWVLLLNKITHLQQKLIHAALGFPPCEFLNMCFIYKCRLAHVDILWLWRVCCSPLQVLVLSTRLLRPTDIPELLFGTQRLVPDIGV